jgi:hypothetical protein
MNIATKGTGAINLRGDTNSGQIRLWNAADTFYAGIQAGAMVSNVTWTLPTSDGASGNVLQTNGSGVLSFVSLAATSRQIIPLLTSQAIANVTNLTAVAYFDWDYGELSTVAAAKLFYNATIGDRASEVEVYNETTATQLGIDSQSLSGFYKFSFTLPTANARLSIRIRKTLTGGVNPNIFGASLIINSLS